MQSLSDPTCSSHTYTRARTNENVYPVNPIISTRPRHVLYIIIYPLFVIQSLRLLPVYIYARLCDMYVKLRRIATNKEVTPLLCNQENIYGFVTYYSVRVSDKLPYQFNWFFFYIYNIHPYHCVFRNPFVERCRFRIVLDGNAILYIMITYDIIHNIIWTHRPDRLNLKTLLTPNRKARTNNNII